MIMKYMTALLLVLSSCAPMNPSSSDYIIEDFAEELSQDSRCNVEFPLGPAEFLKCPTHRSEPRCDQYLF